MKTFTRISRHLLVGSFFLLLSAALAGAAEMRTWTSIKGTKIEAKLLSVDGEMINLQTNEGRNLSVERSKFSAADQQYLVEYGGAKEIEVDPDAKIGVPEKSMKFDAKTVKSRDDKFVLPEGFSLEFKIIESEHFLVMTSGSVRGKDTAELAERLWYGMSFFHPGFKAKWGDEKRCIFLCGDKEDYQTMGSYYMRTLQELGRADLAENVKLTWPQASGGEIRLSNEVMEKYKVASSAQVFDSSNKTTWKRGVWNPFPTHTISGIVQGEMMGGAGGGVGSAGAFAISVGNSYFKEIQLCDETVTSMINANAYEGDEISRAGGFDDGRKWARTLRDLVKKGKVTPSLDKLWAVQNSRMLTPELTVSMYGLSRYMQSTPARMQKYGEFLNRVDTSQAIPQPVETAKIFGFDDVAAFEADWIEYLKSTEFK